MFLIAMPLGLVILGAANSAADPAQTVPNEPRSAMIVLGPEPWGRQCKIDNLPIGDGSKGQLRLERGPASPRTGQIIYAVDRRVDGCPVVLVKSDLPRQLRDRPFRRPDLYPEEPTEATPGR